MVGSTEMLRCRGRKCLYCTRTISSVTSELLEQTAARRRKQASDPPAACINPQSPKGKRGLALYFWAQNRLLFNSIWAHAEIVTVFSKGNTTRLLSSWASVTSRSNRLRVAQNNWAKEMLLKKLLKEPLCFTPQLCCFAIFLVRVFPGAILTHSRGEREILERPDNVPRLPVPWPITGTYGYRAFTSLNIWSMCTLHAWDSASNGWHTVPSFPDLPSSTDLSICILIFFHESQIPFGGLTCSFNDHSWQQRLLWILQLCQFALHCGNTPFSSMQAASQHHDDPMMRNPWWLSSEYRHLS